MLIKKSKKKEVKIEREIWSSLVGEIKAKCVTIENAKLAKRGSD